MTILLEIQARLAKDYVGPVTKAAVTGGIDGLGQGTTDAIGKAIGDAAAGPIADAVSNVDSGSGGAAMVGTVSNIGSAAIGEFGGVFTRGSRQMASGGVVGGVPGRDSVPALLMPNEYVFSVSDVARMGGVAGVQRFRAALWSGGVRGFAAGGDVNDTVGADWFGVSQIPIIGTIVNLLIGVLLKVIGVQIQARNTLDLLSKDFREYRGDFKAFDAFGRLRSDTSGLVDRSLSSTQMVVDERIRILKEVLKGIIKFVIEDLIVPIGKAVANTLINAGAQAAGGAIAGGIGASFPGASVIGGPVGSVVSSLISSAGSATVDIVANIGQNLAESALEVGMDQGADLFQGLFPGLATGLFGGGATGAGGIIGGLGSLLTLPFNLLGNIFSGLTGGGLTGGALGGLFGGGNAANNAAANTPQRGGLFDMLLSPLGIFGSLFGGLTSVVGSLLGGLGMVVGFDSGGMAYGTGLMPKTTIRPERVLSDRQTQSFERLVDVLSANGPNRGNLVTINAPFTVTGGAQGGQEAHDRLLALIG